ncbi:MAG TPA: winged helix-turn-helix domain-containing protein [Thermoanaerobaculia bacterium]
MIRFGPFDLDPASGELRRSGMRIRVQDQPLRILQLLIARRGDVVTREELRTAIWGETFVDFDRALNTAIRKLREALNDSAEQPRYIETVARKGYRFIAAVDAAEPGVVSASAPHVEEPEAPRVSGRRSGNWIAGIIAVVVLISTAFAFYTLRKPATRDLQGVAVLPFVNLTGDPRNEYLADGITESLISDLANVPSLRVISRTSVMQYKNAAKPLPKIAAELGVDGILEGSLLRFGDRARVEVKLIDGVHDTLLWSQQYERSAAELDTLQHDVARAVGAHLRGQLARGRVNAPETNAEAHLLYLRARHQLASQNSGTSDVATRMFREAIAKDPAYAASYAGLAEAELFAPSADVSPLESMTRAKAAAEKAVALAPNLAEAHAALGLVRMFLDHDFVAAEREFKRALELAPGAAETHHRYAQLLAALGRFDEAIAVGKRSVELDPFSKFVLVDYGRLLYLARRYEEAAAQYRRTLAIFPDDPLARWFLILTNDRLGKHEENYQSLRQTILASATPGDVKTIETAYAKHGYAGVQRVTAEQEAQRLRGERFVRHTGLAARFAQLGDRERAFQWLDRAYESHTRDLVYLAVEPQFDPIRDDPRFTAMLKKVGLR